MANIKDFIKESSQGFPWDAAVKDFITKEGSISSQTTS